MEPNRNIETRWQYRLLPFMIGAIIILTIVFIVISLLGINNIREQLNNSPKFKIDTSEIVNQIHKKGIDNMTIAMLMEDYIVSSRYHQARVLTMTNIMIQYFGFLTGMILAIIGSIFILAKIKEDISTIDLKDFIKFKITSSSPGLILSLFGTILMLFTINVKHTIDIHDDSVYLKPFINFTINGDRSNDNPQYWDTTKSDTNMVSNKLDSVLKDAVRKKYGKKN
jgi:hypothetical protein